MPFPANICSMSLSVMVTNNQEVLGSTNWNLDQEEHKMTLKTNKQNPAICKETMESLVYFYPSTDTIE